ncbi:PH domain-containing protein [Actinacidiphila sp. ITFR-21]|uniref:PH domain-containing protein n=1 Tax=Actinacidiphila sp. ITFR-21 TaxID=3075199 RepID=UPI00288B3CFB|nr:PH domain-containing protein [Streptomyces sp. ITFR-21]WNI14603.1 PH domain-containing protein [Streptomyces sp. ITFR-21]
MSRDDVPRTTRAELPVTFRPLVTRVVLLSLGAALFAALTAVAVAMPHDGAAPWSTGERIVVSLTGALFCAVLLLLSRPKAVADRGGLTVINLTLKRRLDWAEVVAVHLRNGDAWVHLDLADGTSLPVMGIQPGIARRRALRDALLLRTLVEELGEARGGGPAEPR